MSHYPGRNSPKDIRSRLTAAEEVVIPALQAEVDTVREQVEGELDIPDVVLLFNAALT